MFGKCVSSAKTSAELSILRALKLLTSGGFLDPKLTDPQTKILKHVDEDGDDIYRRFVLMRTGEIIMLMSKFDDDREEWRCAMFRNAANAVPNGCIMKELTGKEKMNILCRLRDI